MRRLAATLASGLAADLVCAVAILAAEAGAQSNTVGLQVFADINYRGASAGFLRDTPDLESSGMSRTISSLRVAPGEVWQVCTEPNYRGRCETVTNDVSDLRRGGWNDQIASVRRIRGGSGFGGGELGATGLQAYADVNYRGANAVFVRDMPDLESIGMSKSISSLRVAPGEVWQVCTELNYRGRCETVTDDVSDLRRGEWNDQISSMRRIRGGPGFGSGFGNGGLGPRGLQVFADVNYRGASAGFLRDTPDLESSGMSRTISSLRVAPGEVWQVCTEPNYRGRCETVTDDVSDLRRGDWNDRIASARRLR